MVFMGRGWLNSGKRKHQGWAEGRRRGMSLNGRFRPTADMLVCFESGDRWRVARPAPWFRGAIVAQNASHLYPLLLRSVGLACAVRGPRRSAQTGMTLRLRAASSLQKLTGQESSHGVECCPLRHVNSLPQFISRCGRFRPAQPFTHPNHSGGGTTVDRCGIIVRPHIGWAGLRRKERPEQPNAVTNGRRSFRRIPAGSLPGPGS